MLRDVGSVWQGVTVWGNHMFGLLDYGECNTFREEVKTFFDIIYSMMISIVSLTNTTPSTKGLNMME